MSSTIWTRCAGADEARRVTIEAHRMVEAQHRVATQKLVDDSAEQQILEELLERAKPPAPDDAPPGMHYLLRTPFRYPPLRHGSRFGSRAERGIFYAARDHGAAFAEVAYYRFVFLADTTADLGPVATEHTLFNVAIDTACGVDLTAPPFVADEADLVDPVSYGTSQPLGTAMRAAGIEAFLYRSARDPEHGTNVGVFTPRAFAFPAPVGAASVWHCLLTPRRVVFTRRDPIAEQIAEYPRAVFEDGDGALQRVV